ncbi:MAG: hypothetical protein DA396_07860 [Bacteroidetes bacterium]|nr:MAG: hypothetical protein DA396_07860 [Bacteroidota bacterium]PTM00173.1 MAG: hypothetical protein DA440_04850 [Bacteroidota bacterium]PTM15341.1 MAG: hypothetical protein DA444_08715 [Bacteroidota bacterium]
MTGLHKSPDFGYSVEFAQHRAYVPGDSPKHIDWSVLAKTDKYLLKQYEAESNLRTYFILDSSASMQLPTSDSKWMKVVKLLTLIGTLLQKQRDAMGVLEVNESKSSFFEAKATNEWIKLMLNHLTNIEGEEKKNGDLSGEIEAMMTKIPRRSQVIIFIDLFQENLESIINSSALLAHEGHSVRIVFITHSELEHNAQFFSGKQVFDSETGNKTFLDQNDASRYVAFVSAQKEQATNLTRSQNLNCKILDANRDTMYLLRELLA